MMAFVEETLKERITDVSRDLNLEDIMHLLQHIEEHTKLAHNGLDVEELAEDLETHDSPNIDWEDLVKGKQEGQ